MERTIEVSYPVFVVARDGEYGQSAVRNHLGENKRLGLSVFTTAEDATAWTNGRPYYRTFEVLSLPTRRALCDLLVGLAAEVELVCFDPVRDPQAYVEVDDLIDQVLDNSRHRRSS